MSDIRDLYQQVILDHNKNPNNFHKMSQATHFAEGYNPLCGDRYTVYMHITDGTIQEASFQGSGCAISASSASIMTEMMQGKTIQEVMNLIADFQEMLKNDESHDDISLESRLGKAIVFAGVKEFPTRLKCATLAWHTTKSALEKGKNVNTV